MKQHVYSVELGKGDTAILDKGRDVLQVYTRERTVPSLKLTSTFDIVALRDLLNDAYPLEVYGNAKDVRVQSK